MFDCHLGLQPCSLLLPGLLELDCPLLLGSLQRRLQLRIPRSGLLLEQLVCLVPCRCKLLLSRRLHVLLLLHERKAQLGPTRLGPFEGIGSLGKLLAQLLHLPLSGVRRGAEQEHLEETVV